MKIRTLFLSAAASTLAFAAVAQVENDDLYFNSKDRAKLQKQQTTSTPVAYASAKTTKTTPTEEFVNPTDSYSARNVNPEYTARANAQAAQVDNQDYFVNNYQQTTSSNLSNYNNNLNSWYNNDIYSSNYYGSSINSWNSPYYGFNSPSMSPWYNPYYSNTGWSASFSYYWGSSWNYGWGGGYNQWNQPYCAMGWGGAGYSSMYGNPYYSNYNNYSDRSIAYGKRSSRSSSGANYSRNYDVTPARTISTSGRSSSSGTSSGRVASNQSYTTTSSSSTSPYYNRSWRKPEQTGSATSNRNTFFNSNTNSGWSGTNSNSGSRSSSSYSPSRSSSSNSTFSGGGSSSGGGSRSSSSSSRSRGN